MIRTLMSFFLVCICINCFGQILIGKKVEDVRNLVLLDSSANLLVEPAQFSEAKIAKMNSVFYEVVLDEANAIKFISTMDTLFRSDEDLKVGTTFGELVKRFKVKRNEIIKYPGWGNALKLKSGWWAVFDFTMPIKNDSPILFFYQKSQ